MAVEQDLVELGADGYGSFFVFGGDFAGGVANDEEALVEVDVDPLESEGFFHAEAGEAGECDKGLPFDGWAGGEEAIDFFLGNVSPIGVDAQG